MKLVKILCLCLVVSAFALAKPIVSVSIAPQTYFVQKIAGNSVEINEIIPPNTNEHNIDFKPSVMAKLEKSALYFTIGLEFERVMLEKFKDLAKNLQIVDTRNNIKLIHADHSHEEAHHDHDNEGADPHIWLDPVLVKTQAKTIAKALSEKYPQNAKLYQTNLTRFEKELDELDQQIQALLQHKKHSKFVVYHPSWAYFAARYDLVQIPVEIEGKEPKIKDLQVLIDLTKKEKIDTIFVQKGFPQDVAKTLAKECNAKVEEIDHLARSWSNELLKSARKIAQ